MRKFRERKSWIVLFAVLLLFAACKGETPTAPPPGGGVPPGGTPPPSGVNLTLTTTNSTPLVDSTVTITAAATLDGNPVPNGTAVEFTSTGGVLNGNGTAVLRTTTSGAATVTLTSSTAGVIRVSATVNNVTRTIDITFLARTVVPPPPNTAATITSITPNVGRPAGGEIIRITGTNFKTPVRVLFDVGLASPVEGFVVSVTDTVIEVITPPVNLGAGQQLAVDVIVLIQAGTTTEQRLERVDGFTFRNTQLTPIISTVTPNSGPVIGGTRVTIIGEGFQQPVQVLFDTAEARVLNVTFNQILVETPAGRDTAPTGSGTVTGPVPVTVRNISSNTVVTLSPGFFYKAAMQITAVTPGSGPYTGGTRIVIDGIGFVGPVAVTLGGVPAQVISVSGTKIIVVSPPVQITGCSDVTGIIEVTNIVNGDTATGPSFTYDIPSPLITTISPATATAGVTSSITVTVANAQPGVNRIRLGTSTLFPTVASIDPVTGLGTFTVPLPTNLVFPTGSCGVAGTRQLPLVLDVQYLNASTGCENTLTQSLIVNPPSNTCVEPPTPPTAAVATVSPTGIPGNCAQLAPDVSAATSAASSATITFTNSAPVGGGQLTITGATVSGTNGVFGISPTGAGPIAPGGSQQFVVSVDPAAAGAITGTATFNTNDPNRPTINVCITGNANP